MNFRQIVYEPLLHLLLIGLAFFLLYGVLLLVRLAQQPAGGRIHRAAASIVPAYAITGIASYWVVDCVAAFIA